MNHLNDYSEYPSFDPYQLLLRRKQHEDDPTSFPIIQHNPDDVAELEEFCKQHNIVGFNFKNMNPKAALNMLKGKIGYIDPPKKEILNG